MKPKRSLDMISIMFPDDDVCKGVPVQTRNIQMKTLIISFASFAMIVLPAVAQETPNHPPASQAAEISVPKSYSAEDVAELLEGAGRGMAKPAELNGAPGPSHALELAEELELTPEQRTQIEAIRLDMKTNAIALGRELIAMELALDEAFAAGDVPAEALLAALDQIANAERDLRYAHLSAHLSTPAILTGDQIRRYDALRGNSN
jgi:Spy/CpxP family protein refolding chaperone